MPEKERQAGTKGAAMFSLLRDIEARCLDYAAGLPQQQHAEETWEGVLFSVGGRVLVSPLGEVKEILNYPSAMTKVPGTKAWVSGIANIRGTLLPVIDMQSFLVGRATIPGRRSRVLVVDHEGAFSGLLVDQTVGIRHFSPSAKSTAAVSLPEEMQRFITYTYEADGDVWPVFSMQRLAEDADFQFAAAK